METSMTETTLVMNPPSTPRTTSGAVRIRGLRPGDTHYLLAQLIQAAQARGEACAVVSNAVESAEKWQRAGVSMSRLLLSAPDNAEQAAEIVETLVRSGAAGVVIVRGYVEMDPEIEQLAHRTGTRLIYAD